MELSNFIVSKFTLINYIPSQLPSVYTSPLRTRVSPTSPKGRQEISQSINEVRGCWEEEVRKQITQ